MGRDGRGVGACGVGGWGDSTRWMGAKTLGSGNSSTVMLLRGMWLQRL